MARSVENASKIDMVNSLHVAANFAPKKSSLIKYGESVITDTHP